MSTNESTHTASSRKALPFIIAAVLLVAGLVGGYFIGHGTKTSTTSASGTTISSVAAEASATGHNDADITFVQQMLPHHEQAVQMAKLADTRASSADVKALAAKIEAAQQPEIDKMNSWLSAWGASSGQSSSHMDMSSGSMDMGEGMMSASDMASLAKMSGAEFDKTFLTMMQQHHSGAVTMAQTELQNGENSQALALATSIIVTQSAEINQMQNLLN